MQQATVNLFADMGAQPATLHGRADAPPTASTDTTAPTSTITSPAGGATVGDGAQVTITGTATDAGGGVVAGVEVSTDGGTTWHPATGTTSWTYTWTAHGSAEHATISRARSTTAATSRRPAPASTVNVTCPCSHLGHRRRRPPAPTRATPTPVEVGVKFTSDSFGDDHRRPLLQGRRQHRHAHRQPVERRPGTRLAKATFTSETALAAGSRSPSPAGRRSRRTRPTSRPTSRPRALRGHGRLLLPHPAPGPNGGGTVDSPPLHALRNTGTARPTASSPTAPRARSRPTRSARPTTGSTWSSRRPPRRRAVTDVSAAPAARRRPTVTWTAPADRRRASRPTRSRRTSARRRRRRRRSPARRRRRPRRSPA